MASTLESAKGALERLRSKFDHRRGSIMEGKRQIGRIKSVAAGIEGGLKSDVAALHGILDGSQKQDYCRAIPKTMAAQAKAKEVMVTLDIAVRRIDELNGLMILAEDAIKRTAAVI